MPYFDQISGQNKSEACKPEELVKMTNGFFENKDYILLWREIQIS